MNANLAGLSTVLALTAPFLWRWKKARAASPDTPPAFPFRAVGVALFVAVLVATGVSAWSMRGDRGGDEPVILVPDAPVAAVRAADEKPGTTPRRVTAILVREADGRVAGIWEKDAPTKEAPLRIRIPYTKEDGEVLLSTSPGDLTVDCPPHRSYTTHTEVVRSLGSGRAFIPEPELNDARPRKSNLFSLITPGANYRLLCFATPIGVFPMKPVKAREYVASLGWLQPPSGAKTYDEYRAERAARIKGEGFWKAEPTNDRNLSLRLFQVKEYGEARRSPFESGARWFDDFGVAAGIAFVLAPILMTWGLPRRRRWALVGVAGMLLLAVLAERSLAPAVCDAAAYHRVFSVPAKTNPYAP